MYTILYCLYTTCTLFYIACILHVHYSILSVYYMYTILYCLYTTCTLFCILQDEEIQSQGEVIEKLTLQIDELEESLQTSQRETVSLKKQITIFEQELVNSQVCACVRVCVCVCVCVRACVCSLNYAYAYTLACVCLPIQTTPICTTPPG